MLVCTHVRPVLGLDSRVCRWGWKYAFKIALSSENSIMFAVAQKSVSRPSECVWKNSQLQNEGRMFIRHNVICSIGLFYFKSCSGVNKGSYSLMLFKVMIWTIFWGFNISSWVWKQWMHRHHMGHLRSIPELLIQ